MVSVRLVELFPIIPVLKGTMGQFVRGGSHHGQAAIVKVVSLQCKNRHVTEHRVLSLVKNNPAHPGNYDGTVKEHCITPTLLGQGDVRDSNGWNLV